MGSGIHSIEVLCTSLRLLSILDLTFPSRLIATVEHDPKFPQLAFAAQELNATLKESARNDLTVTLGLPIENVSRSPLLKK